MRLVRRPLPSTQLPEQVLPLLDVRARDAGLPPPAALTGEWFGSRAIIAPAVRITACPGANAAFAVPAAQPEVDCDVPGAVGGGWIGYLAYDLTDPSARQGALPPAGWGWADHVLRLDTDGQWWFEALVEDGDGDPTELADELAELLRAPEPVRQPDGWAPTTLRRPPGETHRNAVSACIDAIGRGEVFQTNICTRLTGTFVGSPAELFAEGITAMRPRRAAYLAGPWGAVASLSPELFLARHGTRVHSTPIKGTLPRRGPADDANARLLRESEKDVAENVMITDLVRNDLGRVSTVGTVGVPELLTVREAPGVWHLESTVAGTLAPEASDEDLLRATFPPGSVTGAPKPRALDLIAELEPAPRGVYCGSIGLASPVAGTELNVAIRTLELHRNGSGAFDVELGVGGGITASSDPELEWQECLHKAAPLERLLGTPPTPGRRGDEPERLIAGGSRR
ncbi:aminodeoxychorismate synthase component I [Haloechinothrix sp. YIM 98757]|uniref:Aminodeoxychorismate synthase component I n=1 Tax=Haloechinothrix aidingensis TaxID=2752311 RepID=A0A838A970_9PSEU|nr:aminodeoxychorismate synthase component I [Haloechinothrix aidingensis]MBA0125477.1 aminodeoxychorismate synthase component I [Haloechinothrix aidingensis]